MKKLLITLLAGLLVFDVAGCGQAGTVATDGSTFMSRVIVALGEAWEAETGVVLTTYNATGSGAGIQAVQQGRCDIGLSSRT